MTELTDLAASIATEAHKGQTRWNKRTPYITHPEGIARELIRQKYDEEYVAAAWLHDVIEDTPLTEEELIQRGVDLYVVEAVVLLTKVEGISYLDYILAISGHPVARKVKIEDIRYNMGDWPKGKKKGSLYQKYELALYLLEIS